MHNTQLHQSTGQCVCGRDRQSAAPTTLHSISGTYAFRRCACGLEWTEHAPDREPADVTSRVDVAEVHGQFKAFHWSIHQEPVRRHDLAASVREFAGSLRRRELDRTRRELQGSLGQLVDAGRRLPGPLRRLAGY
jgi:hypothetical protein